MTDNLRKYLNDYAKACKKVDCLLPKIEALRSKKDILEISAAVNSGMPHGYDTSDPTLNKLLQREEIDAEIEALEKDFFDCAMEKCTKESEMSKIINEKETETLKMWYVEMMSFASIAAELGEPFKTVYSRYTRAINKLEKMFKK